MQLSDSSYEQLIKLLKLADALLETDGHELACPFRGCECEYGEDYKVARAAYLDLRRQLIILEIPPVDVSLELRNS